MGYRNEIYSLYAQMAAIYTNIDEYLKKETNLFTGVDFKFGEMNVSVTIDGKTVKLQNENNAFIGSVDVGFFLEHTDFPLIIIETVLEIQT